MNEERTAAVTAGIGLQPYNRTEDQPVASSGQQLDFSVTEEKVSELVRRIVESVDPVAVIAFGSRARGDNRPDSDLDLAVIVDGDEEAHPQLPPCLRDGINMAVDVLPIAKARFDRFRPWINTVHQAIDREGVRLYERGKESTDRSAFRRLCQG